MSSFLPSELARLILGYLEENDFKKSSEILLKEVPELAEFAKLRKQGRKISTLVGNNSLEDILADYSSTKDHVRECVNNHPATFRNVPKNSSLYEQVKIVTSLASCKRNKMKNSTLIPTLASGRQGHHQRFLMNALRDSQSFGETPTKGLQTLLMEVSTTTPASLPGSSCHHNITMDISKGTAYSDHLCSASSSPLATPRTSPGTIDESIIIGESSAFSVDGADFHVTPQKRKGQAKRRSADQNNPSPMGNEANFEKILKNLIENTALHEKIAENINKGLNTQTRVHSSDNINIGVNLDCDDGLVSVKHSGVGVTRRKSPGNPPPDVALIKELDHVVTGILTETTTDPAFENLIEEVFGTNSNPSSPSKKGSSSLQAHPDIQDAIVGNSRPLSTPIPPLVITRDKVQASSTPAPHFSHSVHRSVNANAALNESHFHSTLNQTSFSDSLSHTLEPEAESFVEHPSRHSKLFKRSLLEEQSSKVIDKSIDCASKEALSSPSRLDTSGPVSLSKNKSPVDVKATTIKEGSVPGEVPISPTHETGKDSRRRRPRRKLKTKEDENKLGDQLIEEFSQFQSSRPDRVSESDGSGEWEKSNTTLVESRVEGNSSPECSPSTNRISTLGGEKQLSDSHTVEESAVDGCLLDESKAESEGKSASHKLDGLEEVAFEGAVPDVSQNDPTDVVANCSEPASDADLTAQACLPLDKQLHIVTDADAAAPSTENVNDGGLLAQVSPVVIKSSTIPGLIGCSTVNVYDDELQTDVGNNYYTLATLEPVNPHEYDYNTKEIHQDYIVYTDQGLGIGSNQFELDQNNAENVWTSNTNDLKCTSDQVPYAAPLISSEDGVIIDGQLIESGPAVEQQVFLSTSPSKTTTTLLLPPVPAEEIERGRVISLGVNNGDVGPVMLVQLPDPNILESAVPAVSSSHENELSGTVKWNNTRNIRSVQVDRLPEPRQYSLIQPYGNPNEVHKDMNETNPTVICKLDNEVTVSLPKTVLPKKRGRGKQNMNNIPKVIIKGKKGRPKKMPKRPQMDLFKSCESSKKPMLTQDILGAAFSFALKTADSPVKVTPEAKTIDVTYETSCEVGGLGQELATSSSAAVKDIENPSKGGVQKRKRVTRSQTGRVTTRRSKKIKENAFTDNQKENDSPPAEIPSDNCNPISLLDSKGQSPSISLLDSKGHSPQLKALLSLTGRMSPSANVNKRRAVSVYKSPVRMLVKKSSQSTPRLKTNHIRALDFSTPKKRPSPKGTPRKKTSPNKACRVLKGLKFSPPTKRKVKKISPAKCKKSSLLLPGSQLKSISESEEFVEGIEPLISSEDILAEEELLKSQQPKIILNKSLKNSSLQQQEDEEEDESFVLRMEDDDTCESSACNPQDPTSFSKSLMPSLSGEEEKEQTLNYSSPQIPTSNPTLFQASKEDNQTFKPCHAFQIKDLTTPNKAASDSLKSGILHQTPLVLEAPTPLFPSQRNPSQFGDVNTPFPPEIPSSALKTPLIKDYPQGPYSSSSAGTSYYEPSERTATDSEGYSPGRLSTVYENSMMDDDFSNHSDFFEDFNVKGKNAVDDKGKENHIKMSGKKMGKLIEREMEKQFSDDKLKSSKNVNKEKVSKKKLGKNDINSKKLLSEKHLEKHRIPSAKYQNLKESDLSDNETCATPKKSAEITSIKKRKKKSTESIDQQQVSKNRIKTTSISLPEQEKSSLALSNAGIALENTEDDLVKKLERRLEMGRTLISKKKDAAGGIIVSERNDVSAPVANDEMYMLEGKSDMQDGSFSSGVGNTVLQDCDSITDSKRKSKDAASVMTVTKSVGSTVSGRPENCSEPVIKGGIKPSSTRSSPETIISGNKPSSTKSSPETIISGNKPSSTKSSPETIISGNKPSSTKSSPETIISGNKPSSTKSSPETIISGNKPSSTKSSPETIISGNKPSSTKSSPKTVKGGNKASSTKSSPETVKGGIKLSNNRSSPSLSKQEDSHSESNNHETSKYFDTFGSGVSSSDGSDSEDKVDNKKTEGRLESNKVEHEISSLRRSQRTRKGVISRLYSDVISQTLNDPGKIKKAKETKHRSDSNPAKRTSVKKRVSGANKKEKLLIDVQEVVIQATIHHKSTDPLAENSNALAPDTGGKVENADEKTQEALMPENQSLQNNRLVLPCESLEIPVVQNPEEEETASSKNSQRKFLEKSRAASAESVPSTISVENELECSKNSRDNSHQKPSSHHLVEKELLLKKSSGKFTHEECSSDRGIRKESQLSKEKKTVLDKKKKQVLPKDGARKNVTTENEESSSGNSRPQESCTGLVRTEMNEVTLNECFKDWGITKESQLSKEKKTVLDKKKKQVLPKDGARKNVTCMENREHSSGNSKPQESCTGLVRTEMNEVTLKECFKDWGITKDSQLSKEKKTVLDKKKKPVLPKEGAIKNVTCTENKELSSSNSKSQESSIEFNELVRNALPFGEDFDNTLSSCQQDVTTLASGKTSEEKGPKQKSKKQKMLKNSVAKNKASPVPSRKKTSPLHLTKKVSPLPSTKRASSLPSTKKKKKAQAGSKQRSTPASTQIRSTPASTQSQETHQLTPSICQSGESDLSDFECAISDLSSDGKRSLVKQLIQMGQVSINKIDKKSPGSDTIRENQSKKKKASGGKRVHKVVSSSQGKSDAISDQVKQTSPKRAVQQKLPANRKTKRKIHEEFGTPQGTFDVRIESGEELVNQTVTATETARKEISDRKSTVKSTHKVLKKGKSKQTPKMKKNETKVSGIKRKSQIAFKKINSFANDSEMLNFSLNSSPEYNVLEEGENYENIGSEQDLEKSTPFSVWGTRALSSVSTILGSSQRKRKRTSSFEELQADWTKSFEAYGSTSDVNVTDTDGESPRRLLFPEPASTPKGSKAPEPVITPKASKGKKRLLSNACARATPYIFSMDERRVSQERRHYDVDGEVHNVTPKHRKRFRHNSGASNFSETSPPDDSKQLSHLGDKDGHTINNDAKKKRLNDKASQHSSVQDDDVPSSLTSNKKSGRDSHCSSEGITLHGVGQRQAQITEESLSFLDSGQVSEIEQQLDILDGLYMDAATSAILSDVGEKSSETSRSIDSSQKSVGCLGRKEDCLMSFKPLPLTPEKEREKICHSLVKEGKALVALPSTSKDCASPERWVQRSEEFRSGENKLSKAKRILNLDRPVDDKIIPSTKLKTSTRSETEKKAKELDTLTNVLPTSSSDLIESPESLSLENERMKESIGLPEKIEKMSRPHRNSFCDTDDANKTSSPHEIVRKSTNGNPPTPEFPNLRQANLISKNSVNETKQTKESTENVIDPRSREMRVDKDIEDPMQVDEVSEAESVDEFAESESVDEVPEAESMDEVPEAESVDEVPETESIDEVPETESIDEVPEAESIDKVPESESTDEVLESESVDEVPESKSIDEIPESKSIDEIPESKSIDEVPESESIDEVLESESVDEVPETESIDEVPETESIDEVPESESIDEVPESESESSEGSESEETFTLQFSELIDLFSQNLSSPKKVKVSRKSKKSKVKDDNRHLVNSNDRNHESTSFRKSLHVSAINKSDSSVSAKPLETVNNEKIVDAYEVSQVDALGIERVVPGGTPQCKGYPPRNKPRRITPVRIGEVSQRRSSGAKSTWMEDKPERESKVGVEGKGCQSERSVCSWSSSSPGALRISDSPLRIDSPAAISERYSVNSPSSVTAQKQQNISNSTIHHQSLSMNQVNSRTGSPMLKGMFQMGGVEEDSNSPEASPAEKLEMMSSTVESEASHEMIEDIGIGRQRKARQMGQELSSGINLEIVHSPNKPVTVLRSYQQEGHSWNLQMSDDSMSYSTSSMTSLPPTPGKHLFIPPAPAQTVATMAIPSALVSPGARVQSFVAPSTSSNEIAQKTVARISNVVQKPISATECNVQESETSAITNTSLGATTNRIPQATSAEIEKCVTQGETRAATSEVAEGRVNIGDATSFLPAKKRKKIKYVPEPVKRKQAEKLAKQAEKLTRKMDLEKFLNKVHK